MIIFVEDTNLLELMPLFRQDTNSFDLNNKPNVVYNLSSLSYMGVKLEYLTPPYNILTTVRADREFDIAYAQYILNNDAVFADMFKLIHANYLGYNVFILVGGDEARQLITESLMKFINQRYTLIPRYFATIDDIPDYYDEDHIYVDGIYNMDADRERYVYITTSIQQLEEEMKANDPAI